MNYKTVVKNPADKQEVFDFVLNALRQQGGPCVDAESNNCKYRNSGRKCAAGHLILDEDYKESWENCSVTGSTAKMNGLYDYFKDRRYDIHFISCLQCAHDNAANCWDRFECNMARISAQFALTYVEPNTNAKNI
jgi:hypothetical protein